MPTYEYLCKDCRDLFEKTLTSAAHDRELIACPSCGSKNVEQEFTAFYAITSRNAQRPSTIGWPGIRAWRN
jgi:putative FmdB family regulatory protein